VIQPRPARPRTPQATFDRVANVYDQLNSFLSFGMDRRWRYRAARRIPMQPGTTILDVATGTASLARAVAATTNTKVRIVGCDINWRMLRVGHARLAQSSSRAPIALLRCAGESLPFRDGTFDVVMIAFAIDDMGNRGACAQEMFRVLKPGGRILLLELSLPDQTALLYLYRLYLRLLPFVARIVRPGTYEHVHEEILSYKGREAIAALLGTTGFVSHEMESLTGGVATLHVAHKPGPSTAGAASPHEKRSDHAGK
jgi:demethylmenaquinone methyltransferase/2-methoxy-6-polyprenyl-1,4-benzoquinol methylase